MLVLRPRMASLTPLTSRLVACWRVVGTVVAMESTAASAYRLFVHRDGEQMSLASAIEEVWSGLVPPEQFDVRIESVAVPQQVRVPHESKIIEMAPDIVSSCPSDNPRPEVR